MKKVLLLGGRGLVGRHIHKILKEDYEVVITSGKHKVDNGYTLDVSDLDLLNKILEEENPDIVISSLGGDFKTQLVFHEKLANWIKENKRKFIYISTANVFDNDKTSPWTETKEPDPESEYGIFKRDCERLVQRIVPEVVIFRLCAVWAEDANRLQWLLDSGANKTPAFSLTNDQINITYADQIGWYAKYVLAHDLKGVFHVGSKDLVDWHEFNLKVCEALDIKDVTYNINTMDGENYQAVIPGRNEIPDSLQLTVEEILQKLKENYQNVNV